MPGSSQRVAADAFDTYLEWYCRAHRARGGDPIIGRRLVSLLAAAGVEGVDARVVQPAGTSGDIGRVGPLTAAAASASIIGNGIATASQVEELGRRLTDLGRQPGTIVTMPRVVQAWGTRP